MRPPSKGAIMKKRNAVKDTYFLKICQTIHDRRHQEARKKREERQAALNFFAQMMKERP